MNPKLFSEHIGLNPTINGKFNTSLSSVTNPNYMRVCFLFSLPQAN